MVLRVALRNIRARRRPSGVIELQNQRHKRVVINTQRRNRPTYHNQPREAVVALALISAAALATFAALLITSRPYDPMNSTIAPQESVQPMPIPLQPTPKPSPTASVTPLTNQTQAEQPAAPGGETLRPDDTEIKSEIDRVLSADDLLSNLDITAAVENGKVTLIGSVPSPELKVRAEKLARAVAGVTAVNNQLIIEERSPQ